MFVVGCFIPATLMAKVEKVTLKGTIKGLGNEELILMNIDQSEIARTKTKMIVSRSRQKWKQVICVIICFMPRRLDR